VAKRKQKTVYDLELHEALAITTTGDGILHLSALRVPGGWIYSAWDEEKQEYTRDTFVPLVNDFVKIKNPPVWLKK